MDTNMLLLIEIELEMLKEEGELQGRSVVDRDRGTLVKNW